MGFPIRRSAGQWICAPNRSLSQLVTSFFGSQCQGIHPALFLLNRSDFPLACGRQAFSWFSFLLHVCIFRCFTMSSYPTLRISTKRFYRYSVFMVHRAFPLYKPSEICTLTHRCEALYKKRRNARQPPAFPRPHAVVSSAGWIFTVVFGMGTGVSSNRITTGQLFLISNKELTHRPLLFP